ncbi:hypothetical protein ABG768_015101, partial [Culter alburnus]
PEVREREAPGTATNQPSITLTDPHNCIPARSPLQAYPSLLPQPWGVMYPFGGWIGEAEGWKGVANRNA